MSYSHYSNECTEHHDLVVDFGCEVGATRPRIVVLCGSTRFRSEFRAQERRLSLEGVIATGPGTFGHCGDPITEDDKTRLDELHRRKIELADEVFVVNPRTPDHPDGYIGPSTADEIAYAETLGKPVSYLVEASETAAPERPEPPDATRATCEHAALRPRCDRDRDGRCVMCCAHYHVFSED